MLVKRAMAVAVQRYTGTDGEAMQKICRKSEAINCRQEEVCGT